MEFLTYTKKYWCIARENRGTYLDPFEERQPPITLLFADVFYPYHFETDVLSEMQAYVAENGIFFIQEEW